LWRKLIQLGHELDRGRRRTIEAERTMVELTFDELTRTRGAKREGAPIERAPLKALIVDGNAGIGERCFAVLRAV
jgi:hypothetical protein